MFALIAAVLFGVALLLQLIHEGGGWVMALVIAGLLCVALHLAPVASRWRDRP
jgi:hypothetical protein